MEMSKERRNFVQTDIMAILLATLMVLLAEVTGEKEIIFPEIAALTVGYWVAPKRSWMVNGKRMLFLITISAVIGLLIVLYSNVPLYAQVILAFAISQIVFIFSGTTFAPFISAMVLPVLIQTRTWIYPISAFVLTLIIVLGRVFLNRISIRENEQYEPITTRSKYDLADMLIRIIIVAVVSIIALKMGYRFVIAPPLLVAFTELSRPGNKARNVPIKTIILVTGCAIIGAFTRYIISIKMQLPLYMAAFVIMILVLTIVHLMKMYMPPAGAVAILSLLIPQEAVAFFPLQILAGISIFMIASRLIFARLQNIQRQE